jgi:hypothetical protein
LAKLVKLKFPEASVVVDPVAAPARFTVTPLKTGPETAPEMENVGMDVETKFCAGMLALFTVTARLAGVKVKPDLLGATV